MAICIIALIYGLSVPWNSWDKKDLDQIILEGDALYIWIKQNTQMKHDFLLVSDVPQEISRDRRTFAWKPTTEFSGFMHKEFRTQESFLLYSLEDALQHSFISSDSAILVYLGNAVVVHYSQSRYYLFDSHSRDAYGQLHSDGFACCFSAFALHELCHFIRNNATSLTESALCFVQFHPYFCCVRSL